MKTAGPTIWRGRSLAVLAFDCVVGAGTMEWATGLFREAGTDAWISVLLALSLTLALGTLLVWAAAFHNRAAPGGLLVEGFGPWVGIPISVLFVVYVLVDAARMGRTTMELLHFAVLPRTPGWILMAMGLAITVVLLTNGIESMLRYQLALFWPALLLAVLSLGIGFRFSDWANFLPILRDGLGPPARGLAAMAEPIAGLELTMVFLPHFFRAGVPVRTQLYAVWSGSLAAGLLYLYVTVALLVGFGPFETKTLTWPVMEAVRRTFLTGLFFERLDLLFLISLLIATTSAQNLYLYAGITTIRQTLRLPAHGWHVWVTALLVLIVALVPSNLAEVREWYLPIGELLGVIFIAVVPLLLVATGWIKQRRRRRQRAVRS